MGDLGEFDSAFVQAPDHRPNPHPTEAEGIPLIDLSPISSQEDVQNLSIQNPSAIEDLIKQVTLPYFLSISHFIYFNHTCSLNLFILTTHPTSVNECSNLTRFMILLSNRLGMHAESGASSR